MENRKSINGEMLTRDETVIKNHGLIWSVANRYKLKGQTKGLEPDDLYNIAAIGLIKAYDKFDPETYDVRFSTYAVPMMVGELQRYFRDNAGDLKFSRLWVELANKILKEDMQDEPMDILTAHFDEDEVTIKHALYVIHNNKAKSLHMTVYQGEKEDITLEDQLGNNDLSDYTSINVNEFLESLSERDRKMVELTMQGLKQSEIGKRIGTSQVQVSRLMRKLYDYTETFFGYPLGYFQDRPNISIQEGEKKMKDKVKKGKFRSQKGDIEKAKELLATTKWKNARIAKETGVSEQSVHYWAKKIRTPEAEESPVTISHIEPITIEKTVEEVQEKIQEIGEQIFSAMGVSEEILKEEPSPRILTGTIELEPEVAEKLRANIEAIKEPGVLQEPQLTINEASIKAKNVEFGVKYNAFLEKEKEEEKLMDETDQFFTYAAQKEGVNPSEIHTIFTRIGNVAASSGLKKLNVSVAVSTEKLPNLKGAY